MATRDEIAAALLEAQPMSQDVGELYPRGYATQPRWGMIDAPAGMPFGVAMPQEQPAEATAGDVLTALAVPSSWTEAGMMAMGPAGRAAGIVGRTAPVIMGALADLTGEAEAGKLKGLKQAAQYFAGERPRLGNAGVDAPANRRIQTVDEPYRMMFPGIYRHPKEIVQEAFEQLAPRGEAADAMKRLWGVTREDLDAMALGRVGTNDPSGVILAARPKGSVSAENIMTPRNTQRLLDVLSEAEKIPGLKHADAWYVLDPVFWRLKEMYGAEEAVKRFRHLNTMTSMASPGSDVLTEIQRGTAAHWLEQQGRFSDFEKFAGLPVAKRGEDFPADMRYILGHPYHRTSQSGPMRSYIERGELKSEAPKVPLYAEASGVPQTGFQTTGPVGDAHFSRGTGLTDTRKGPSDVQGSFSLSEYQTLQPWWKQKVAGQLGVESVPAQARAWTVFGPQTGIDSPLGQGKLEMLTQQILVAAKRLGVSPEKARDLILSGGAGAGVITMMAAPIGELARQDTYQ